MKRTRLSLNKNLIAPLVALLLVGGTIGTASAQSQDPQPPAPSDGTQLDMPVDDAGFDISFDAQGPGGRGGMGGMGFVAVCSTTSSTDVVAKALGMTAAELRLALVSGKSVSQIAASKNIDVSKIQEALTAQRKADLEQAVKDGLITQAQLDAINQMQANAPKPSTNNANPAGNNMRFEIRVPANNTVNRLDVAAKALSMTCADLVKAEQAGKSIAQVAQEKNVAVQTVIDAVVNAVKAAAAQDVKEGLITQAQADAKLSRVANDVGQWVYSTRGNMGGPGGRNGGPGGNNGGPNGNNGGNNGNNGQPRRPGQGGGAQPTVVPPAATPAK